MRFIPRGALTRCVGQRRTPRAPNLIAYSLCMPAYVCTVPTYMVMYSTVHTYWRAGGGAHPWCLRGTGGGATVLQSRSRAPASTSAIFSTTSFFLLPLVPGWLPQGARRVACRGRRWGGGAGTARPPTAGRAGWARALAPSVRPPPRPPQQRRQAHAPAREDDLSVRELRGFSPPPGAAPRRAPGGSCALGGQPRRPNRQVPHGNKTATKPRFPHDVRLGSMIDQRIQRS